MKRLFGGDVAKIVEHLVPESGVEKMKVGVFGAPHIKVNGKPKSLFVPIAKGVVVCGIKIPKIVPI